MFPVAHYTFRTMQVTNYYPQQQQQSIVTPRPSQGAVRRMEWSESRKEPQSEAEEKRMETTEL